MFLQDGDEVKIKGQAGNADYHIGFGECSGKILPCLYEN
jgi:fumarylacetoacetase